jgi:hypothetical protein
MSLYPAISSVQEFSLRIKKIKHSFSNNNKKNSKFSFSGPTALSCGGAQNHPTHAHVLQQIRS